MTYDGTAEVARLELSRDEQQLITGAHRWTPLVVLRRMHGETNATVRGKACLSIRSNAMRRESSVVLRCREWPVMPMPNDARSLWSVPAISGYVGTIVTLWSVVENALQWAVVTLVIVCLVLAGYLIVIHRKYRVCKPFRKVDEHVRRMAHHMRDHLHLLKECPVQELERQTATAIKSVLNDTSNIFSTLVGERCTSSIMLPDTGADTERTLMTAFYCHNVHPQRENVKSTGVLASKGIVGRALVSGEVVTWTRSDAEFVETRRDYHKYYASGLTAPIKMGSELIGVLNVDCPREHAFQSKLHSELGAAAADVISSITAALALRRQQTLPKSRAAKLRSGHG